MPCSRITEHGVHDFPNSLLTFTEIHSMIRHLKDRKNLPRDFIRKSTQSRRMGIESLALKRPSCRSDVRGSPGITAFPLRPVYRVSQYPWARGDGVVTNTLLAPDHDR